MYFWMMESISAITYFGLLLLYDPMIWNNPTPESEYFLNIFYDRYFDQSLKQAIYDS